MELTMFCQFQGLYRIFIIGSLSLVIGNLDEFGLSGLKIFYQDRKCGSTSFDIQPSKV